MTQAGITVLYFAWLRERVGAGQERIDLPDGVRTASALIAYLRGLDAGHDAALGGRSVRCAINQEFATPEAPVAPGDEVAFFPPVTGG